MNPSTSRTMAPKKRVHFAEDLERTPSPSYSSTPPASPMLMTPPTLPNDIYTPRAQPSSPFLTSSPASSRRTHARTPSPLYLPAAMLVIPHPTLSTSSHPGLHGIPSFIWDVTLPLNALALPAFTTQFAFTPAAYAEPATKPALPEIVLRYEGFPWKMIVRPRQSSQAYPAHVTVYDLLQEVYRNLQQPVTREEYNRTPAHMRAEVDTAYYARCDRTGFPDREVHKGVKRVDFLRGKTTFRGIEPGSKQGEFCLRFS